jgi:hypothetical protein
MSSQFMSLVSCYFIPGTIEPSTIVSFNSCGRVVHYLNSFVRYLKIKMDFKRVTETFVAEMDDILFWKFNLELAG